MCYANTGKPKNQTAFHLYPVDCRWFLVILRCCGLQWKFAALYVLVSAICMGALIFISLYFYFRKQEQIMENAVTQIR
ncbi:hypothetical protein M3212_21760, partial [Alkalihalobacillus oceani]|uniref:hypothetical protein n=1 Tax=Halalkalibacter oceani TaxID=1653776 RepID=UPI00203D555C